MAKKMNETEQNSMKSLENPKTSNLKSSRKYFMIVTLAAFSLLALAIGVLAVRKKLMENEALRQSIISSPYFHEGIEVEGIPLGGLRMEEAVKALEAFSTKKLSAISFEIEYQAQVFPVTGKAFGMQSNMDVILAQAFSLGRQGTLAQLEEELQEIRMNKRRFSLIFTPDENTINAFVENIARQFDTSPKDAGFQLLFDKNAVTEEEKKKEAYVTLAATRKPEQSYAYMHHQDGIAVNRPELTQALLDMAKTNHYFDIDLPTLTIEAEKTLEDVQDVVVLRGIASTSFAKSPYNRSTRVFNIKKAVGLINGTVLQPGEVFSTNEVLGNRTYNRGWKPAPAIVQGRTEDQAGGGVCQVSTTLYNCVLKSDLEIVYRQGHSGKLSYVGGGLDATIDSGRIDFKWKNNTNAPLYIFGYVDEEKKQLFFEIHGAPFPDMYDEIQLSSKKISGISPSGSMHYTIDHSKPMGYSKVYVERKSGSLWESYKTYLKNGVEVRKEAIGKTVYKAYAGETIIGPSAAATPVSFGRNIY